MALRGKLKQLRFITISGIRATGNTQMLKNGVNDKNNYFSKNMIVKTINIQVISVYENIFLCVILFIWRFINPPPQISKEKKVIHNKIQKQLLTIL